MPLHAPNQEDFREAAKVLRKSNDYLMRALADAIDHAADHWWVYMNPHLSLVVSEVLERKVL